MAWGLWSFVGLCPKDMNPLELFVGVLWSCQGDTISLKQFFLECEASSLIVGVYCGTWALLCLWVYVLGCRESLLCVWVHCHLRSLFCFHLSITDFVPGSLLCVCQGCLSYLLFVVICFSFVRSLLCLWVDDVHRTCASLLFWMYGQGLEISHLFELWNECESLSYLLVYVSGWGVLIGCGGICGVVGIKVPKDVHALVSGTSQKSFVVWSNHLEIKEVILKFFQVCTR